MRFGNISLICAHAPTEEKDDNIKDDFYDLLERTYDRCPSYDTKIVLGDFNAQLGREGVFAKVIEKHSLDANTSGNGLRLVDFASGRNFSVANTRFHTSTFIKVPGDHLINQPSTRLITLRSTSDTPPISSMSEPSEVQTSTRIITLL